MPGTILASGDIAVNKNGQWATHAAGIVVE